MLNRLYLSIRAGGAARAHDVVAVLEAHPRLDLEPAANRSVQGS